MVRNPYHYNGPLDPVKKRLVCLPREEEVNRVIEGINRGDYWAILGPRQIGKTTFLRLIKNKLTNAHHIHFNFQVPPPNKKSLYKWMMKQFKKDVPSEQKVSFKGNESTAFGFFEFLEKFSPKDEKKIILFFDEIDGLPDLKTFLHIWRKLYHERYHKKELNRYVIILAGAVDLIEQTVGPESPFNIAEVFEVKDFSDEESAKLINVPMKALDIEMDVKAKEYLISQVSGHPQMLQHLCHIVTDMAIEKAKPITNNDVDNAIEVLFKSNTVLNILKIELEKDNRFKELVTEILEGKEKKYYLYKEFSISGVGAIVDMNNYCAIRNNVYKKLLIESLGISEDRILFLLETSMAKKKFIQSDPTNRYKFIEQIGYGGMGEVWKAWDLILERNVAIKKLHQRLIGDTKDIERFYREAQLTASLSHPNIVVIHDVGKIDKDYFISMEFIDGPNLGEIINAEKSFTIPQVLYFAKKILDALSYSHEKGIIHRDIKPKNIILTIEGKLKLVDFGIAAILKENETGDTGILMGTPLYMAPEQCSGKKTNHLTDIYSTGVTLFHLAAGRPPYKSEDKNVLCLKHLFEPVPSIKEFRKDIPDKFEKIISRCMAKKPEDRFSNVRGLLERIKEINDSSIDETIIENEIKGRL